MGKSNVNASIKYDRDATTISKWQEEESNLRLEKKSRTLIFINSHKFENISIAASSGCIAGLIYGPAYFGCVETGLLGLLIGGGIGYILDRVLPAN